MAEEIKVVIGADTAQLSAELKAAENNLKKFKTALASATDINEIKYLERNIGLLQQKIGGLQGTMPKLASGSNQAAQSLNNLGRIAQDAPFGFIGIQNNINPLLESFTQLKAQTGSTGSALKSLVAGLAGPAGLGLAVSVGTALLTTFAGSLFNSKSKVNELDSEVVVLSKDIKNLGSDFTLLKGQLDLIAKSRKLDFEIQFGSGFQTNIRLAELNLTQLGFAQSSAKNEFDKAKAAYNSANDALFKFTQTQKGSFSSTNEFNAAVQELGDLSQVTEAQLSKFNDEQKAYILNVVNASKKVNDLGVKYYDYFNNIELARKQINVLTEDEKRNNAEKLKNLDSVEKVLARLEKSIRDENILANILGTPRLDVIQKDIKLVEGAITTLIQKFNLSENSKIIIGLRAQLQDFQFEKLGIDVVNQFKKSLDDIGPIQAEGLTLEFPPAGPFDQAVLNELYRKDLLRQLQEAAKKSGIRINIFEFLYATPEGLRDKISEIKKATEEIAKQVRESLKNAFSGLIQDIGTTFAETLAGAISGTATFGDFFKNLFSVLGKGVEALGKDLLKIGALALVAKLALDQVLTNPYALIAAGVALTALGALIQQSTNTKRFAVGTRNAPGGMALVGERGPELVNLPRGSQVIPAAQTSQMMGGVGGSIEVFGILRGQDIYFSNKKYSQTYGRTT